MKKKSETISSRMIQITRKLLTLFICISFVLSLVGCQQSRVNSPFEPVIIETQGEGIIIIRESDLERMGTKFPESGTMRLTWMGEEVPAWMMVVEDESVEKSLVFYSPDSHSRYSLTKTYQLESYSKPLPHIQTIMTGFWIASSSIKTWVKLEEDLIYEPQSKTESHYLWKTITTSTPFLTTLNLNGVDKDKPAKVILSLRKRGAVDKHQVRLVINDLVVGDKFWEGEPESQFEFQIPDGKLIEGKNTIMLEIIGEESDQMVVDLDWVKIEYYRKSFQEMDHLQWQGIGDYEVISGWKGLTLTLPIAGGEGWISQAGPGGVVAYSTTRDVVYVTADERSWRFPKLLRPVHSTNSLEKGFSGAEYVILTPSIWESDLEPLADYYRSEGLKTTIATLDAIYDRFSGGQVDPSAIQKYLQAGLKNWEIQPKYALLVGDFVNNPTQLPENGAYLPGFFISSQYGGETVSDYPFSLGEDNVPIVAIGRWPVNNRDELRQLVRSTIHRQAEGSVDMLVSSMVDPSASSFSGAQDIFLKLLNPDYNSSGSIGVIPTNQTEPLEVDAPILAYFGHGSLTAWGNPPLLNTSALTKPWINHPEIVLQFTCLSGYFVFAGQSSLSEVLLKVGVPAVIGPTSLTLPGDQWALVENWAKALQNADLKRSGDLLLFVWQNTSTTPAELEVTRTYQLFGDPAYFLSWKSEK
jgi:hypothetical protein